MTEKEETKRKMSAIKKKEGPIGEKKEIEFTLYAPEVREVFLGGEFNSWDPQALPMKKDAQGVWRTKLKLPAGHHQYKFFIDGAWFEGCLADAEMITNPFGTQNFIKEVL